MLNLSDACERGVDARHVYALAPKVELLKQYVPEVQGNCEFIEGSPEEVAKQLIDKLRADSII